MFTFDVYVEAFKNGTYVSNALNFQLKQRFLIHEETPPQVS